jgi:DNA-binding CsgD family transcriptional regulator
MDRNRLEGYLDQGLSLPQIGMLENRDPSTVGYWVKKHGLVANGRSRFAPKGGVTESALSALVGQGLTIREISSELGLSESTVNYWLRRHGLKTERAQGRRVLMAQAALAAGERSFVAECREHGNTRFLVFQDGRSRCARCAARAVAKRRRVVRETLVAEAGGACVICGYSRCINALQFHHRDRKTKAFGLSDRGIARSLDKARAEARKCVLLCANCHAEVEAGETRVS